MKKWLFFVSLLVLLAACHGNNNDDNQDTETPPEPQALLSEAAQAIESASSFQLVLETSGAPVYLDAESLGFNFQVSFQAAEGEFVAPDQLHATTNLMVDDIVAEAEMVAIGEQQYVKAAFTFNQWQALTFARGFNPAQLLSPEEGIANALRSLQQTEYVGREEMDGLEVYHIRGEVEAGLARSVTVGLIGTSTGNIKVDVFIRTNNGQLERLQLEEPLNPALDTTEPTIWVINLYGYNEDYTIERPEVE